MFDHYQALVIALCTKLRLGQTHAAPNDTVGGSTFGFDVWPGHPEYENVLGFLRSLRAQGSEFRKRVTAYNEAHPAPDGEKTRVVTYMGQAVIGAERDLCQARRRCGRLGRGSSRSDVMNRIP